VWVGQRRRSQNPCAPLTFGDNMVWRDQAERGLHQSDGCVVIVVGNHQIRRVDAIRRPHSCARFARRTHQRRSTVRAFLYNLRNLPTYRREKMGGRDLTSSSRLEKATNVACKIPSGFKCPASRRTLFDFAYRSKSECSAVACRNATMVAFWSYSEERGRFKFYEGQPFVHIARDSQIRQACLQVIVRHSGEASHRLVFLYHACELHRLTHKWATMPSASLLHQNCVELWN
jgi:hypothetical protein